LRTVGSDWLAEATAAAVVEVVGASVVVVVLLLLVVVSSGRGANVDAVVADAAWDLVSPPPSADEHATMVSATAIAAATAFPAAIGPLGRLSILITAFDSTKSDIVPHFFPRGRQILKFGA
jgi:Na+-transporting methylmalonyl-CoA/oxaloacetate decarboxylase gamma subunit